MSKGMGNPLAIAAGTVALDAGGHAVKKGTDFLSANAKPILIGAAVVAGVLFIPIWYKSKIAKDFARNNVGNPNLIAAGIIYNSIQRVEPSGVLSFIIPDFTLYTDENALYNIAGRVTSLKDVSDAYYKLFNRALAADIQLALDTEEMQRFYDIISRADTQLSTPYPIGSELYVNDGNGITVNTAEKVNGTWSGGSGLYGKFDFRESIGKVFAQGIVPQGMDHAGKNYYIVEDCNWLGFDCDYGVVVHSQVTNEKI